MTADGVTVIDGLHCVVHSAADEKPTFLFVNALTGSTDHWETSIAPTLREAGYGTVSYNFRGQSQTRFNADDLLDETQIISDLQKIAAQCAPNAPILVGLSIGGLFAARAILAGTAASGLVLLNTLREPGLTLDWTNEAVFRAAQMGGSQLVMDLFLPMLLGPTALAGMREKCLGDSAYHPLATDSGIYKLVERSRQADWNVPYENLKLPTLVMTGLRDRVFLDREAVARLIARLPDAEEVTLPDVGHLIPVEAPTLVSHELLRFAAELGGS